MFLIYNNKQSLLELSKTAKPSYQSYIYTLIFNLPTIVGWLSSSFHTKDE